MWWTAHVVFGLVLYVGLRVLQYRYLNMGCVGQQTQQARLCYIDSPYFHVACAASYVVTLARVLVDALQDFVIASKNVMQLWQGRKLSCEQAKRDLVRSRCPRAPAMLSVIALLSAQQQEFDLMDRVADVLAALERSLGQFRDHPEVARWQQEREEAMMRPHFRAKSLLLRGKTRSGKSQKGLSLFGYKRTLVVNCQGLGSSLPSLRGYCHTSVDAIVFDEIDEQQVLANKMVFQCGPWPVELSQSVCGQHAYKRWFYGCAMILCSNTFRMRRKDGLKSKASEDWLVGNIIDARLADGEVWYLGDTKTKPSPEHDS